MKKPFLFRSDKTQFADPDESHCDAQQHVDSSRPPAVAGQFADPDESHGSAHQHADPSHPPTGGGG